MFTGIVEEVGHGRGRGAARATCSCVAHRRARRRCRGLPPGASIAVNGCCLTAVAVERRRLHLRADRGDAARAPRFDERLRPGRARQPRAAAAGRRPLRRPHRPGPRGRRRARSRRCAASGEAAELDGRAPARARALPGGEGLGRRGRHLADRGRARRPALSRSRVIPYTLEHTNLAGARAGRPRQPRGRRDRQIRRAAARPASPRVAPATERGPMPFSQHPRAIEDIRAGPDGRGRGRRGPRERGRPHDRGREGHARGHQLHGPPRPRPDLPAHDRRAARRAAHPAHGARRAERRASSAPRSACPIEAKQGTTTGISAGDRARTVLDRDRSRRRSPATWRGPATCSRCARVDGGVLRARRARPRPRWTSRAWPASIRPGVICEIMDEDGTMARGAAARGLLPRSTASS